jgi:hypothetical protein
MESALIAIIISLLVGSGAYFLTSKTSGPIKVSKREFIIGSAISILILLIVGPLTEHLILSNKTKYYEYFNGYETAATEQAVPCERDGNCEFSYDCDVYYVTETYYTYDEDGNAHAHTRIVAKYHDCPYLKTEYRYTVTSTLDDYRIGSSFAKDRSPWRAGEGVPGNIPNGPPQLWLEAKARIDAHRNGGVTKTHAYKNFLLASDKTILDQYSGDIQYYTKNSMLPDHTLNYKDPIYNQYMADKFSVVDLKVDNKAWNESLSRLNGYLGEQLQGDVHMVAVNTDKVKDKERYSQALFAYWKGHHFEKYAFPKNAIGVVVGIKDGKVEWSRATGGLPVGNEALFTDIQNNLVGIAFEPDALIGLPLAKTGALYSQLYGPHKFVRPCMECIEEKRDGYQYLSSDIYISGSQRFWIIFITTILSIGMWTAFLYIDDRVDFSYY